MFPDIDDPRHFQWKVRLQASCCVRNVGDHVLVFSLPHRSTFECRSPDVDTDPVLPFSSQRCTPSCHRAESSHDFQDKLVADTAGCKRSWYDETSHEVESISIDVG